MRKRDDDSVVDEPERPDGEVAALRAKLRELNARLTAATSGFGQEPGPPARFLLFVPLSDRYELVEQVGRVPQVGSEVELSELSETPFLVSKLGRSPLPVDGRPCAYLQPVR